MVRDRFGRTINYLRISLTDRCNLRCVYCMPEQMVFRPKADLLQDYELYQLLPIFVDLLGFDKIRLTGGEPTLREGLVDIVGTIAATAGVNEVALTTNGLLLPQLAQPLADAGLRRVNVSIDTLNPDKFRQMTRWGSVEQVWDGLKAAAAVGLGIKLNAVVVQGFNDTVDVVELARLTYEFPWQVRFIEMMPFGDVAEFQQAHTVSEQTLLKTIGRSLAPPALFNQGALDGEARLYQLPGALGTLGFISSVTQPFCAACNRVRLTADGRLRLCLLRDRELDLLTPLRQGASSAELRDLVANAIWDKPWGHGLADQQVPSNRVMSEIGG
jgi:cyclic pyranopterin phosphate synthase